MWPKSSRPTLDVYDRDILRALLIHGGYMNKHQIATQLRISWVTVDRKLERLYNKGYLSRTSKGNVIYYKIK
jgi:Mn-dependent DtxR family transcriptional regulator